MDWSVYLTDKNGVRLTDLNDNFGFEFTRIANAVGSFSIDLPPTFDDTLLSKDSRVEVYRNFEGKSKLVFCGLVNEWELTGTIDAKTTVGGRCINHLLKRRVVLKDAEGFKGGVMLATASIAIAVDDVEIYRALCPDETTWTEIASLTSANNESECMAQATNGNVIVGASLASGTDAEIWYSTKYPHDTFTKAQVLGNEGYVHCVTSLKSGTLLAGTATDSEIYRSTNYGATWASAQTIDATTGSANIRTIAQLQNGSILAIWSDSSAAPIDDAEVWQSIDDGQNWSQIATLTDTRRAYHMVNAKNGNVVVSAMNDTSGKSEWLVSEDNGYTWTQAATDAGSTYAWRMLVLKNGDILCGTYTGGATAPVWISQDNGLSWSQLSTIGWGDGVWGLALDWDGAIIAGVSDYGTPAAGRFYRSTDNGLTWAQKGAVTGLILIEDILYAEPVR